MKLDISKPFTLGDVANLLASADDESHSQLRVTHDGYAYISKDVGFLNLEGVAFRFETWSAGHGFVGKEASKQKDWVRRLHQALTDNWPDPKNEYVETY
jgi:hypothetical protein